MNQITKTKSPDLGITFKVSDVPQERGKMPVLDQDQSIRSLMKKPVEALDCTAKGLVICDTSHAFAKAAHDAFYEHYPLRIRPDDVWFCIVQGFASHVNLHAEELRSRFVQHEGKVKLVVECPDFVLGQDNPWPEVITTFSEQVGEQVGKVRDLISARFSTTTQMETAAFETAVMDTFQGYFEYEMIGGCGIPEITLLGTPEDWASMIPRVRQLSSYGLETWADALVPVLEKLVLTASGQVDAEFWESFFRYRSGSGPKMTGWILTLFPYLEAPGGKGPIPNPFLANWKDGFEASVRARSDDFGDLVQGPPLSAISSSLVSAPVHYRDLSTGLSHDLRFVAGMFGVEQEESTGALSPAFGWAIVYDEAEVPSPPGWDPGTPDAFERFWS